MLPDRQNLWFNIKMEAQCFRTVTYMAEHGYMKLNHWDLSSFVSRLISNSGPLELLAWVINKYGPIKLNHDMIQNSFNIGSLEYIKLILNNDDVVKYIFENFNVKIVIGGWSISRIDLDSDDDFIIYSEAQQLERDIEN